MRASVFMARDGLPDCAGGSPKSKAGRWRFSGSGPIGDSVATFFVVIPAKAGIHRRSGASRRGVWPGFRGGRRSTAPQGAPREEGASRRPKRSSCPTPGPRRSPRAAGARCFPSVSLKLDRLLAGGLRRNALHEDPRRDDPRRRRRDRLRPRHPRPARRRRRPPDPLGRSKPRPSREAGLPYGPASIVSASIRASLIVVVRVRRPGEALWVFEEGLALPRPRRRDRRDPRPSPPARPDRQPPSGSSRPRQRRHGPSPPPGGRGRAGCGADPLAGRAACRPARSTISTAGIGRPAWRLALERNRHGQTGSFDLEWDHDTRRFALAAAQPGAISALALPYLSDRPDHAPQASGTVRGAREASPAGPRSPSSPR